MILQEIAIFISDTPNLSSKDKISLLTYISTLQDKYPNIMDTVQMQMMQVYLNNLILPSAAVTAYMLSAHYKLDINKADSGGSYVMFDVSPLQDGEYFNEEYTAKILDMIGKITAANFGIYLRIYDPYDSGYVVWYDPFFELMSVKWESETGGYTVRDNSTTRRMFHDRKLYGSPDDNKTQMSSM